MSTKKGEVIIKAQPYANVLALKEIKVRCSYCFKKCDNLKTCTVCKLMKYCGQKCQKADWSMHKLECKCFKQAHPLIASDSVRLFLRIIIKHLKGEDEKIFENDPGWRCFSELESHSIDIQKDEKRSAIFAQMCHTIKEMTQNILTLPPIHTVFAMFGKMVINTFSICDDENQPIGSGLYLSPSQIDHSCDPNAVAVFYDKRVHIRAIKDIPDNSPNKIFLSYVDQMKPSAERILELEEQYYFTCTCSRCQNPEIDELMYSVKCQEDNCDGFLGITQDDKFLPCSKCKIINCDPIYISLSVETIENAHGVISDLEDIRKSEDFSRLLSKCENTFKTFNIFSSFNVYYVRLLDLAFDSCINLNKWNKALEYGQQTLEPYRRLYPKNIPNVAVQLLKVGKIFLYLEMNIEAIQLFVEAEAILVISHGTDHALYKTLQSLMLQCREELREKERSS